MEHHDIQRMLRARYGGLEASAVLIQFGRIELGRPDAIPWMQNGKFYEVYGDPARLIGRLLDLRVAEKPLMTGRDQQPVMLAMTGITIGSEREHLARLLRMGYRTIELRPELNHLRKARCSTSPAGRRVRHERRCARRRAHVGQPGRSSIVAV